MITVPVAAERLAAPPEAIIAELEAGRLKGFTVGGEWRTTEDDLLRFIGHHYEEPSNERDDCVRHEHEATTPPTIEANLLESRDFDFSWPRPADDRGPANEHYSRAFAGTVRFQRRLAELQIGFTAKHIAGMHRERAIVFLKRGWTLMPLVQFVGANDFDDSRRLASVIKKQDGSHLRPGEPVPAEYRQLPLCVYAEIVVGKHAARSVAVLAEETDRTTMAHHGMIRAMWKGLL